MCAIGCLPSRTDAKLREMKYLKFSIFSEYINEIQATMLESVVDVMYYVLYQ